MFAGRSSSAARVRRSRASGHVVTESEHVDPIRRRPSDLPEEGSVARRQGNAQPPLRIGDLRLFDSAPEARALGVGQAPQDLFDPRDPHEHSSLLRGRSLAPAVVRALCQVCHSALSSPLTKTSSRPSAFRPATGAAVVCPPNEDQPLHPLLGAVCQMCQSALSVPGTKTSSRPSALLIADGVQRYRRRRPNRSTRCWGRSARCARARCRSPARTPRTVRRCSGRRRGALDDPAPSDAHPLHPLFGAVCQMCQSAPSVPRTKIASRPSALLMATT